MAIRYSYDGKWGLSKADAKWKKKEKQILEAIENGDFKKLDKLTKHDFILKYRPDFFSLYELPRNPQMVEYLIRKGAMLDDREADNHVLPIHKAFMNAELDVAKVIASHGTITAKDADGKNILMYAVQRANPKESATIHQNRLDCVNYIFETFVKDDFATMLDNKGRSVLAYCDYNDIFDKLVENGAKVTQADLESNLGRGSYCSKMLELVAIYDNPQKFFELTKEQLQDTNMARNYRLALGYYFDSEKCAKQYGNDHTKIDVAKSEMFDKMNKYIDQVFGKTTQNLKGKDL